MTYLNLARVQFCWCERAQDVIYLPQVKKGREITGEKGDTSAIAFVKVGNSIGCFFVLSLPLKTFARVLICPTEILFERDV